MSELDRLLEINVTDDEKYQEWKSLKSKLEEHLKKVSLFDSLLVENQTILDTISQVKIANKMFSDTNKKLEAQVTQLQEYKDNVERLANDDNLWNNRVDIDNIKAKLEKIETECDKPDYDGDRARELIKAILEEKE